MICKKCGAEIKEGRLFCSVCGTEIRIVPDYNPLEEEMLNELLEKNHPYSKDSIHKTSTTSSNQNTHSEHKDKTDNKKSVLQKWILFCSIASVIAVILIILFAYFSMTSSYTYLYNKGVTYENSKEYEKALSFYKKALNKNEKSLDARFAIANIYTIQKNNKEAIHSLLSIISLDKTNKVAFQKLIQIYRSDKDYDSIKELYKKAGNRAIKDLFADYMVSDPVFDQDAGVYNDSLTFHISSPDDDEIYYTIDGSNPEKNGNLYDSAITLSDVGSYKVKAVCKNDKGVYSSIITCEYDISISSDNTQEDLQVNPKSGTYPSPQAVTITVPSGYLVYYTWDGSIPTQTSTQYTQPIDIPSGNNILSVIYVDLDRNISEVSRFNYICN